MKKIGIWLFSAALMIGIASCGEKQKELTKTIPASAVKISGDCSNYFTIDGDSVKILLTHVDEAREYGWEVRAIIPMSKTSNAKTWSELEALPHREEPGYAGMMGFSGCDSKIKYLDTNGTEIDLDLWTNDINEFLKTEGTSSENIVVVSKDSNYENHKARFDKVSGIKLVMDIGFKKQFSNEKKPENTTSSSGNKWDTLLDEYENYVDKYVSFYKKAMNGDMSAMTEYVSLLEKAEKLSSQLETSQNDMSSAQMKRYLKITEKMSNALLNN